MPTSDPILIDCEGSGQRSPASAYGAAGVKWGICPMCGLTFRADPHDLMEPHQRDDVLARLDRGDFDA